MTAATISARGGDSRRVFQGLDLVGPTLPVAAILGIYLYLGLVNPRAFSYVGVDLILGSAVPLVLAAVSQTFVIALGDLDLGIGFFVGLVNAVVAIVLTESPLVGAIYLIALVGAYGLQGALITARQVPSLTFTLGSAFVWLGLGRLIAPTPRASLPDWLGAFMSYRTPFMPLGVWLIAGAVLAAYVILFRSRVGLLIRSAGSNREAYIANGGSMIKARTYGYALAGVFGILAGIAITGVTGSADVTASADFTLLSIAAVILGGGAFSGGKVSALGTVAGAVVFSLVGVLMIQLQLPSSLQVGAKGLGLIFVIAGRRFLTKWTG